MIPVLIPVALRLLAFLQFGQGRRGRRAGFWR